MSSRALTIFCSLLAFAASCSGIKTNGDSSAQAPAKVVQPDFPKVDLQHLKAFEAKYPKESGFFSDTLLTQRLQKLMGKTDYDFMLAAWAVESPIIVDGEIVSARGCEAHNCGATNFIVITDLEANVLYAGVRKNNEVKTFSENGNTVKQLTDFVSGL